MMLYFLAGTIFGLVLGAVTVGVILRTRIVELEHELEDYKSTNMRYRVKAKADESRQKRGV